MKRMKKNNKKGFTMAELLIVVAIIAVLVAIAIPIFNSQLEKSKQAVDEANCRSAYGQAMATYLSDPDTTVKTVTLGGSTYTWDYDSANGVMHISTGSGKSSLYANSISYDGTSFY